MTVVVEAVQQNKNNVFKWIPSTTRVWTEKKSSRKRMLKKNNHQKNKLLWKTYNIIINSNWNAIRINLIPRQYSCKAFVYFCTKFPFTASTRQQTTPGKRSLVSSETHLRKKTSNSTLFFQEFHYFPADNKKSSATANGMSGTIKRSQFHVKKLSLVVLCLSKWEIVVSGAEILESVCRFHGNSQSEFFLLQWKT